MNAQNIPSNILCYRISFTVENTISNNILFFADILKWFCFIVIICINCSVSMFDIFENELYYVHSKNWGRQYYNELHVDDAFYSQNVWDVFSETSRK